MKVWGIGFSFYFFIQWMMVVFVYIFYIIKFVFRGNDLGVEEENGNDE